MLSRLAFKTAVAGARRPQGALLLRPLSQTSAARADAAVAASPAVAQTEELDSARQYGLTLEPPVGFMPPLPEDESERDLVNFPRRVRPVDRPAVRLGFLPEEWFTMFHKKTGVTGPYMFLGGLATYLASKEIWIVEHDFFVGAMMFAVFNVGFYHFGADVNKYLDSDIEARKARLDSIKPDAIARCQSMIDEEEKTKWMATRFETLIEAKRENVGLQLEAAYRERMQDAYQQVKNRLDYQLQVANVMRRTEQQHMVNWIMDNVRKSITPKQEEDALKKCMADLKMMAK